MFSFCHNFCWLLGESFINCENLTDYCYFAKILKSSENQSVLKVYYLTKNRQKWVKSINIRKLQVIDYQYNIFFCFLLFSWRCTGSGYYNSLVNQIFTREL